MGLGHHSPAFPLPRASPSVAAGRLPPGPSVRVSLLVGGRKANEGGGGGTARARGAGVTGEHADGTPERTYPPPPHPFFLGGGGGGDLIPLCVVYTTIHIIFYRLRFINISAMAYRGGDSYVSCFVLS